MHFRIINREIVAKPQIPRSRWDDAEVRVVRHPLVWTDRWAVSTDKAEL
jgi:hypothetical protein